ncbi:MAG: MFS transporter, partial [FCB group bacterium]
MKSSKSERIGWYFYDWANSVFHIIIVTVFLGPYLTSVTKAAADSSGHVYPFGIPINAGSFFPYIVSISVIFQFVLLPFAGAIADYTHNKKIFLGVFAYIGAISCMGMYFLNGSNYFLGGILFIIANISFGVSLVMYDAYLNDIAEPERRDAISSIGWAFGYLGGGI